MKYLFLSLILLLPSLALGQFKYPQCYNNDTTAGGWTLTIPAKRLKCRKSFSCFKRHSRPKRVDNIVWHQARGDRLGSTWGTVGWTKTVIVASNDNVTEALRYVEGIEPASLGDTNEINLDLEAHWGLVNELKCEHFAKCKGRSSCERRWFRLPSLWKSFGESVIRGLRP